MTHDLAIKSQAVERYFLDELAREERDAFEDHFFSCELCAADVRATAIFLENAKAVLREEPIKVPAFKPVHLPEAAKVKRNWFAWLQPAFPMIAAAALAVIVFQNTVTIPALKTPRAIPAVVLDLTSRASVPQISQADPLHFDVATDQPITGDQVWTELRSESGKIISGGPVAAPKQGPVDVYFPGSLDPGRYVIAVRAFNNGKPQEKLGERSFEVTKH
jgi:hypothetical protein